MQLRRNTLANKLHHREAGEIPKKLRTFSIARGRISIFAEKLCNFEETYTMAIIENRVIGFEILYVTLLQLISRNGMHLINLFNDAINFHIELYYSHIILYQIKKIDI